MTRITRTLAFDEHEIVERFVRAAGPHGQNAIRDATAVELRLDLASSSLPVDMKERLRAMAGRHISRDVLVVVSRGFRSQIRNREAARARLLLLLQRAADERRARTATEPPPAARDRRLQAKHQHAVLKRGRRVRTAASEELQ